MRATPRAKQPRIELSGDLVRIYVTAPPEDGKANEAICELLADRLGIAKRSISVVRGHSHRNKLVRIDGLEREQAFERLGA